MVKGELARRIQQLIEDSMKKNLSVPGLVIGRLISDQYRTTAQGEAMYSLNELQRVTIHNGNVEAFQNTWVMVLSGMKTTITEDILHELYYGQVQHLAELKDSIAYYKRLDDDHPEKSYKWLYDLVEKHIAWKRKEQVKKSLHKGIGPALHPALGAKGKKGKGKGKKGKGKGKGKTKKSGKTKKPRSSSLSASQKRKTLCQYWARGVCRHESERDCGFRHSHEERKPKKRPKAKAKAKAVPAPPKKHPAAADRASSEKKKKLCREFKKGTCSKSHQDCPFSHSQKLLATKTTKACSLFMQGNCTKGKACSFSHESSVVAAAKAKAKTKAKAKAVPAIGRFMKLACAVAAVTSLPTATPLNWTGLVPLSIPKDAPTPVAPPSPFNTVRVFLLCADDNPVTCANPVAAPARKLRAAAAHSIMRARKWLMDTGCGNDIVNIHNLPEEVRQYIHAVAQGITFETANGIIETYEQICMEIPALGDVENQIAAWCLGDTPDVLSIGYRCQALGYGFIWPPYADHCFLVPPECKFPVISGKMKNSYVRCEAEDYIPYLTDDFNQMPVGAGRAAPATAHGNGKPTVVAGSPVSDPVSVPCDLAPALPAGTPASGAADDDEAEDDELPAGRLSLGVLINQPRKRNEGNSPLKKAPSIYPMGAPTSNSEITAPEISCSKSDPNFRRGASSARNG